MIWRHWSKAALCSLSTHAFWDFDQRVYFRYRLDSFHFDLLTRSLLSLRLESHRKHYLRWLDYQCHHSEILTVPARTRLNRNISHYSQRWYWPRKLIISRYLVSSSGNSLGQELRIKIGILSFVTFCGEWWWVTETKLSTKIKVNRTVGLTSRQAMDICLRSVAQRIWTIQLYIVTFNHGH